MTTPPPPPAPTPSVQPAEITGRGRALIAVRAIKPGETILTDTPLLVYPSSLCSLPSFCASCFRSLHCPPLPCPSCRISLFCSPRCLSNSHPPFLCFALPHLPPTSSPDLLFLLSAYSLPPNSFQLLLSLRSPFPSGSDDATLTLHSQLSSLLPSHLLPPYFSPDTTAALLTKEKTNAFSLMEPFNPDTDSGAPSLCTDGARAYGIYLSAALFNHDCLPNACRFDYVDGPNGEKNTDIVIRALHDIPEGREVCLSYFPVNWGYKERHQRLMEDYGFDCQCDRCKVESQWKDNEVEQEEGGEEEEMEEEEQEMMEEEGNGEDFPHAYFFVKFMCDKEKCGGTMAPLPPSRDGLLSDLMECNVCAQLRKEGEGEGHMAQGPVELESNLLLEP